MVVIGGKLPVKPEAREQAVQIMLKMAAETHKEDGCNLYDFWVHTADPNTFLVFEEWESQEHLDRHVTTPHMTEFMEGISKVLSGKSDVKLYTIESAKPL